MAASIFWLKYHHVWRDYDDSYAYDLDSSFSLAGGDGTERTHHAPRPGAQRAVRAGWLRNRRLEQSVRLSTALGRCPATPLALSNHRANALTFFKGLLRCDEPFSRRIAVDPHRRPRSTLSSAIRPPRPANAIPEGALF